MWESLIKIPAKTSKTLTLFGYELTVSPCTASLGDLGAACHILWTINPLTHFQATAIGIGQAMARGHTTTELYQLVRLKETLHSHAILETILLP